MIFFFLLSLIKETSYHTYHPWLGNWQEKWLICPKKASPSIVSMPAILFVCPLTLSWLVEQRLSWVGAGLGEVRWDRQALVCKGKPEAWIWPISEFRQHTSCVPKSWWNGWIAITKRMLCPLDAPLVRPKAASGKTVWPKQVALWGWIKWVQHLTSMAPFMGIHRRFGRLQETALKERFWETGLPVVKQIKRLAADETWILMLMSFIFVLKANESWAILDCFFFPSKVSTLEDL